MQEGATVPPISNRWLWAFAVFAFLVVEFLVIGAQIMKRIPSPLSLRFYYLPIMLTLPLTTALPLRRELINDMLGGNAGLTAQVSRALALVTLIAYLTLIIGIGESL